MSPVIASFFYRFWCFSSILTVFLVLFLSTFSNNLQTMLMRKSLFCFLISFLPLLFSLSLSLPLSFSSKMLKYIFQIYFDISSPPFLIISFVQFSLSPALPHSRFIIPLLISSCSNSICIYLVPLISISFICIPILSSKSFSSIVLAALTLKRLL